MKFNSITYTASLLVAISLVGCNGSESTGSKSTAEAPIEVADATGDAAKTPQAPSAPTSPAAPVSIPVSPGTTVANATISDSGCPGDFAKDAVVANYRSIGMEIQIDCAGIEKSNYFSSYRPSDIAETLKTLDRSFDLFKNWARRPAKIVIGGRAYHSSKENLIQVPYVTSRPQDLEDYLHDTHLLMDMEITDFNRAVRFSYVTYDMAHKANGEMVDVGTGALIGYGVARQQIVKDDIARVRKLKNSILQMPYKNVRLTHANQMGSFIVSKWSDAYTLPTEYTDAQLAPYFKYLTKLASVQKSFGDISVSVMVPSYPSLEIDLAIRALDTLATTKPQIQKLDVKAVQVAAPNISDIHNRFRVTKLNRTVQIENIYKHDGKMRSAVELKSCLEKADFTTKSIYYCDGQGDLRY